MSHDKILEFWNEQAALSERAGTRDLIAKQLEIGALSQHVRDGMSVCEFGCGNGITAIHMATHFAVRMDCFDFAEAMVSAARQGAAAAGVADRVTFGVQDVRTAPVLSKRYDLIYTERMLINLPDWEAQSRAIAYLGRQLAPGGRLVLCENSQQGLAALNALRQRLGLDPIVAPWHNCYLDEDAMSGVAQAELRLVAVQPFSSTYYFLSRVINAAMAREQGVEPRYDGPINQLALKLPPFGDCAQGKLWVLEPVGPSGVS